MIAVPIGVNSRGLEGPARPAGPRRVSRAFGIAIGIVALGACAAFLVGLFENFPLTSSSPSAHAPLPADLFAPPRAPKPVSPEPVAALRLSFELAGSQRDKIAVIIIFYGSKPTRAFVRPLTGDTGRQPTSFSS